MAIFGNLDYIFFGGADAPGACRLNVDSRNALTEGIGSGNAEGFFAPEKRLGGVDQIVLSSQCLELSYLYIEDGLRRLGMDEISEMIRTSGQ